MFVRIAQAPPGGDGRRLSAPRGLIHWWLIPERNLGRLDGWEGARRLAKGASMFVAPQRMWAVRRILSTAWVLALLCLPPLSAQQPAGKRSLTHADADAWRSIQGQQLSHDGKYLAYFLAPQQGDG